MTVVETARLGGCLALGLALGAASFASLRLNTGLYLAGALWRPIALHLVRLATVAAVLVFAVRLGAAPLLAVAAGVVIARPVVVRLFGRVR